MPPDFLTLARKKKIQFFGKIYSEENTKKLIGINNRIIRASRYLRDVPGEHTYLPKKTGIFSVKINRN